MEAAAVVCPPKFYIVHRDGLRTGDADKKYDLFDDDDDDDGDDVDDGGGDDDL